MDENIDKLDNAIEKTKDDLDELLDAQPGEGLKKFVEEAKKAQEEIAKTEAEEKPGSGKKQESGESEYQKMLKERLKDYAQYSTEAEKQEDELYQDQINKAKQVFEAGLTTEQENARIMEGLKQDHEKRLNDIEARAVLDRRGMFTKEFQDRVALAGNMFSQLTTLTQSKSAALVAIGKAARYAETIMNTASAAMANYNQGAQIGGPALGAAFAAIAIAAGAVQLATINSTSLGGGGSVSGGAGISDGSSAAASVSTPGVSQSPGNTTNVKISLGHDDGLLPVTAVRSLLNQLKAVAQDSSGQFNLMDSTS
jgi:hypothetical protein